MSPLHSYSATRVHTWQWVTVENPFKHKQTIINAQLLNFHKQAACIDFPFKAASKSEWLLKGPREGTVTLCINKERAVKARRENSNIVYQQRGRQKMRQTESLDRIMTQCINTEKETESHRELETSGLRKNCTYIQFEVFILHLVLYYYPHIVLFTRLVFPSYS